MKLLIRLFIVSIFLGPVIFAADSVHFVAAESPKLVRARDYDDDHIFLDLKFASFDGTSFGSGSISEDIPTERDVNNAYFFPNPFSLSSGSELGYELSRDMTIELRIYNMMGNEIYRTEYASGTQGGLGRGVNRTIYNRILFNNSTFGVPLSAGIYFFVLMNDGDVLHKGKFAIRPM